MNYTYRKSSGEDIWTVGYDDNGTWIPESDWESEIVANWRAEILNGSIEFSGFIADTFSNLREQIEGLEKSYRTGTFGLSGDYHRGAADACGLILDLPELRLFLPAKGGRE